VAAADATGAVDAGADVDAGAMSAHGDRECAEVEARSGVTAVDGDDAVGARRKVDVSQPAVTVIGRYAQP